MTRFFILMVPPLAFEMTRRAVPEYLVVAFLSGPLVHTTFAFFLGWNEFMPFLPVPSVWDLL
jgi:hypothetical protein